MPVQLARPFAVATLLTALLSACYDMPLIPDESPSVAGSAGHGKAGAGGAPASAGASNAGGGAKPNGGGGTNAGAGGASAGSAGKSGGTAGTSQAGSGGAPGITWLELSASTAPSSFATNAELGIEGVFYAYGDGCSTLDWDEAGRCASGKLCPPEESPDNWGISIGFDFHNTGPDGIPPNAKLTWNPVDHKARGVAWRIHGQAPKLQVWVLNMAETWKGQCTGMPCEIDGPPDGVAPAALDGELHFDHMIKDTWGSGTEYTFDPAAVHALQFKIAAVKVGNASFDFCIDALGIIPE